MSFATGENSKRILQEFRNSESPTVAANLSVIDLKLILVQALNNSGIPEDPDDMLAIEEREEAEMRTAAEVSIPNPNPNPNPNPSPCCMDIITLALHLTLHIMGR